jgi:AbrB family looped-hinge helix DNA binding protein
MATFTAKVEESGRVLIPASVRKRLGIRVGEQIIVRVDETGLSMGTRDQAIERIQRRLHQVVSAGRVLSQELIKERRAEARREK